MFSQFYLNPYIIPLVLSKLSKIYGSKSMLYNYKLNKARTKNIIPNIIFFKEKKIPIFIIGIFFASITFNFFNAILTYMMFFYYYQVIRTIA